MKTATATPALLHDLIASRTGWLWVGFRYSTADAAEFASDQEMAGADFLTLENRNDAGSLIVYVISTRKPTRPAPEDRSFPPIVAAVGLPPMLQRSRLVRLSEGWAAALARSIN
jgi:hypothetical protein